MYCDFKEQGFVDILVLLPCPELIDAAHSVGHHQYF